MKDGRQPHPAPTSPNWRKSRQEVNPPLHMSQILLCTCHKSYSARVTNRHSGQTFILPGCFQIQCRFRSGKILTILQHSDQQAIMIRRCHVISPSTPMRVWWRSCQGRCKCCYPTPRVGTTSCPTEGVRAAVSTRLIISLFGAQIHRAGGSRGHQSGLTAQYSPKIITQEGKDGLSFTANLLLHL